MADGIRILQKKGGSFKVLWSDYCVQSGGGRHDPHKHHPDFLFQFFEFMADQALHGGRGGGSSLIAAPAQAPLMTMSGLPQHQQQNPAKRMRDNAGMAHATSYGG